MSLIGNEETFTKTVVSDGISNGKEMRAMVISL